MLTAEKADEALLRGGRTDFYRPIHFERYKKPQVVEYPRHAVVLNPQHTRLQRDANTMVTGSSSNEKEDEDPLEKNKRAAKSPDDDDDDPRLTDPSTFICSDDQLRQLMQLHWKEVGPIGQGLENMGNTCFANAVLQAISYTPALAQYFAYHFKNADKQLGAPYDFAYALGETIRQLHLNSNNSRAGFSGRGGRSSYRPVAIMSHLRNLSPHFQLGRQCDAHEFAVQLLFAAQKSILFRHVGNTKLPHRVTTTTGLLRICGGFLLSQVSWSRQDEMEQLIKKGKKQAAADLKLEAEGRGDKMVSNTYDPMTILTVELAGQTLEHCLQKFCEKEKLDGRCYHTPRDVGVRAEKQFFIHMPPNVLVIQIKRFSPSGGKAGKMIRYPLELNLHPFCSAKAKLQSQLYTLNAVCVHQGHTINSGHYYSVVRARNGSWHECNDSMVRVISEDRALQQEAYMLFYSRKVSPLETPSRGPSTLVQQPTGDMAPPVVMKSYPPGLPLPQHGYPHEEEEEDGLGKVVSDEVAHEWIKNNNNNNNNNNRSSLKRRGSELSQTGDNPGTALHSSGEKDDLATSSPKQRQREERHDPEPSAAATGSILPAWRASTTASWPLNTQRRSPGRDNVLGAGAGAVSASSSSTLSLTGIGREPTSRTLSPSSTSSSAPVGGYFSSTSPAAMGKQGNNVKKRLPPLPHELHSMHEQQHQQEQVREQHLLLSQREDAEDSGVAAPTRHMNEENEELDDGLPSVEKGGTGATMTPSLQPATKRSINGNNHFMGKRGLYRNNLIASRTAHKPQYTNGYRKPGGAPQGSAASKLLEIQKKEAITLQRSDQMPKFQQKMRDPLWEQSLDQGRMKKVRSKQQQDSGEDQTNRFQKAAEQKRSGGGAASAPFGA